MAGNKIKVYWIFLLMLLYMGTLVMSVGQTQARYESTAVSTTMLETDAIGIFSDCMVRSGEPAVTVLLGDLETNETITVPITIRCVGESYSGKLLCGVTEASYQEYLDLYVSPTGQEDQWGEDQDKILTLGGDGKTETIDLTLTIHHKPVAHEMLKINVVVTWGDKMWGTFQVILPEVAKPQENQEAIDNAEESDGTEGSDKEEGNENSDDNEDLKENDDPNENIDQRENNEQNEIEYSNSEGENSAQLKTLSVFDLKDTLPVLMEVTDDIISVRLGMGVSDADKNVVAFPKGTRLSLDGGKSYYMMYTDYAPEFVLEKSVAEENTEDPETASVKENITESNQPATEENPGEGDLIQEEKISETQDQSQKDENAVVQPLAELEENPTDQNATKEAEKSTEQEPTEGTDTPAEQDISTEENQDDAQLFNQTLLLLDFSHTELKNGQQLLLAMEAYSNSEWIDRAYAETTVGTAALTTNVLPMAETAEIPEETQPEEGQLEEESKPDESIQKYSKPILNQDYYMELTVPEAWKKLDVDLELETDCILEILTMTDDGSLGYREVSITEESLLVTYTNNEQEHKLELKLGEKLPQAGTYRLNLNWKYEGVLFKQTQTTFFINYSEYLNRDLGRLEVQTND